MGASARLWLLPWEHVQRGMRLASPQIARYPGVVLNFLKG